MTSGSTTIGAAAPGPVATARERARGALVALLGLALPVDCAGCGEPDVALCGRCRAQLAGGARRVPLGAWPDGPPAWAAAEYRDEVRHVVVAWKERGRHDLARPLASAVAAGLLRVPGVLPLSGVLPGPGVPVAADVALDTSSRAWLCPERGCVPASRDESGRPLGRPRGPCRARATSRSPSVVVVPVPSSRAARRRRGDRHVQRLALLAAGQVRAAGGDVRVVPALHLVRRVLDQSGLGRRGRAANLEQAMAVRPGAAGCVRGRRCVVVDDVLTTGVTVREAGRALRASGAVLVGVVGGCATPLVGGLSGGPHLH